MTRKESYFTRLRNDRNSTVAAESLVNEQEALRNFEDHFVCLVGKRGTTA